MDKPTEPQVSVTDTADIKVLSAAAPSWSVQTHDPTRMFPNPRNARRALVGEQHRPPRCRRTHLAGLARLDQPSDLTVAAIPWERDTGDQMPWSRTAAADVDGQDLAALLHRIAEGTEPVWENTAWTVDGHGIPPADGEHR